jgi:hypothetical protein
MEEEVLYREDSRLAQTLGSLGAYTLDELHWSL